MGIFRKTPSGTGPRPVVVLGSSSSEQFDYIFGDNPDYHPLWASGWTARGLRQERAGGYAATILAPIDRRARLLLNFGSTDINWHAANRAAAMGTFDFPRFLGEVRDGIHHLRTLARKLGFRDVHAVFAAPPTNHDARAWLAWGIEEQLPLLMRAKMNAELARLTANSMPVIDLISALSVSPERPILADRFHRKRRSHHPNYVATQEVVWAAIHDLDGMLPRRDPPHRALYPHKACPIVKQKAEGTTRPRTCR